jgi:DNA-binding NarL/FixJ family response regulator
MPGRSEVEATRRLVAVAPESKVLVVSGASDTGDVAGCIQAGACGYLTKRASEGELVAAVRMVGAGCAVFSPSIAISLAEVIPVPLSDDEHAADRVLSERELDVLRRVAEGKENAEIARELFISPETVKNHISKILAKLHVDNRIQAAVSCPVTASSAAVPARRDLVVARV